MDKATAKTRIEKLKAEISRYRYAYHVEDRDLVSPEALDSLKKELFDLEGQFPELVTPDSPTQRIGGKLLPGFKKVEHVSPRMNSLNDTFSPEDLRAWFARLTKFIRVQNVDDFYCDLKMDGLAVELVYKDGIFVAGSTRGDGLVGEDITENLKTIEAIPLRLERQAKSEKVKETSGERQVVNSMSHLTFNKLLVVRGEVFLTKKEFERINREQKKKGEKIYANPRNVAAGSLRQLDPKITASRKLDFYAYSIAGEGKDYLKNYPTRVSENTDLKKAGLKTNPYGRIVNNLEEIIELHEYWAKHRESLPYEIDGVVVSLNRNDLYERAGIIGKAPRGAVAFKFSPREATTIIEDIKIQVGRTGALTPVANLRPVRVGGITITHASLHNMDEIERLGLKVGDTVLVSRAGDVIPQVTKVLPELRTGGEKNFSMPKYCPIDGSKVIRDGVAFKCSNPRCGARLREGLYHFGARPAFDIRGLGPKIIDRFLDEGLITDAADIFTLKEGDIAALPRFGEKSAENIVREVKERSRVTLRRLIYALGIIHVGDETAALLARSLMENVKSEKERKEFSISNLLKTTSHFTLDKLQEIPDIGPKVARSIYNWFREKRNTDLLKKLERVGVQVTSDKRQTTNDKLVGKTLVLTGSLKTMSREEAKEKIRSQGGEISGSVSKDTDYVVAGENSGSKYKEAKRLNVKIISEGEFLSLIS